MKYKINMEAIPQKHHAEVRNTIKKQLHQHLEIRCTRFTIMSGMYLCTVNMYQGKILVEKYMRKVVLN